LSIKRIVIPDVKPDGKKVTGVFASAKRRAKKFLNKPEYIHPAPV
jgi:hypothetical protein